MNDLKEYEGLEPGRGAGVGGGSNALKTGDYKVHLKKM